MTQEFSPPWDQPCWLILNTQSLLANLDTTAPQNSFLDLRSPLMAMAAMSLVQDFKRRGFSGFLANYFCLETASAFREGWKPILAPPFSSFQAAEVIRKGFAPALTQVGEAIYLSNSAQTLKKSIPFFLRLRGLDLMADQGPASLFSLLETVPSLPRIDLEGFILDEAFASKPSCDAFSRAVGRAFPSQFPNLLIGPKSPWLPHRFNFSKLIGKEILGIGPNPQFSATLTLQAWGTPIGVRGESMRIAADLGYGFGLPPNFSATVAVEDVPGKIVAVEEWRTILETSKRPDKPTPWKITLFGSTRADKFEPTELPHPSLEIALDHLCRKIPFYALTEGIFTPISAR